MDINISIWKDGKGVHVFFVDDGIGLHIQNVQDLQEFLDQSGGGHYDEIAREVIRTARESDVNLSRKTATFTFNPAKAVEKL